MPVAPSESFLTSKAGPLPVWGWGVIGLSAAYGYSRYKANKNAAATGQTGTTGTAGQFTYGAGQPVSGQPTYLIENNIPGSGDVPSTPVVTPPTPTPPVVTPPSTNPQPPVATPPPPVSAPPPEPPPPPPPPSAPPPKPPPVATGGPPPPRPSPPPPRPPVPTHNAITYRVRPGDTMSKIASMYHVPGGWQALYAYNTNPQYNSAYATFKRQGPNLLYSGQTIHVPQ